MGYEKEDIQMLTGHRSDAVLVYNKKREAKAAEAQTDIWECIKAGVTPEKYAEMKGERIIKL